MAKSNNGKDYLTQVHFMAARYGRWPHEVLLQNPVIGLLNRIVFNTGEEELLKQEAALSGLKVKGV